MWQHIDQVDSVGIRLDIGFTAPDFELLRIVEGQTPTADCWIINIHKDGIFTARETLPDPLLASTDPTQMIRVCQNDFGSESSGRCRWAINIEIQIATQRDPVCRAVVEILVVSVEPLPGHPNRMLLRLAGFILPNEIDHVVLPVSRTVKLWGSRIIARAFVTDLIEDIVQVIDGINHLMDISLLKSCHIGSQQDMGLFPFSIVVQVTISIIDVV